jgi:hypothetical protein
MGSCRMAYANAIQVIMGNIVRIKVKLLNFYSKIERCVVFFTDDCENDADCNNHGSCVELSSTGYPLKVCYCNAPNYGQYCEQGSCVQFIFHEPKVNELL